MKILLVSTLKRRIAPEITASRSRIIYEIASGMVKKGHQVSILGTGDSVVEGACIIPIIPKAFVDLPSAENQDYAEESYRVQMIKRLEELSSDFDVIHNHSYPEFPNLLANIKTPMLTTIHAQPSQELDDALSLFPNSNLISISKSHMSKFTKAKFLKYVYNGIDTNLYSYVDKKGDYLLWIGRLSKAKNADGSFMDPKGVKWAIKLAEETGDNLIILGNVEDERFFEEEIKPHLNEKIKWHGPVAKEQVIEREEMVGLMQRAKAFLMTVNWEEPFGLVMAEAMSCGTPVIGFDRGSVSELVADGETGFVVSPDRGVEGLREALGKIGQINSSKCRERVEKMFSIDKMIENYENVYKEIIGSN